MNTHWNILKITTFWESHWTALWVVIDWFPSWFKIDTNFIQTELDRRKPGQSTITTKRNEDNSFEIVSGIFEWKTTGHPICMLVYNKDQDSSKYDNLKDIFRPNHADLTYFQKYQIRDHRGWWRSSWRETVSRVLAWALAKQYLKEKLNTEIIAYTKQVWNFIATEIDFDYIEKNKLRTWDKNIWEKMIEYVENIAKDGNSIWWIIECCVKNPSKNLWEPVFGKIKAILSSSMLSIWWVLWFEYWAWFDTVKYTWKSYNEWFINNNWNIKSPNNRYTWILGGISTWEDIIFRVAVKPTSSIYSKQKTVNKNKQEIDFQITWRHDPCILPRVIPVIESMAALDILDLYLLNKK